MDYLKGTLREIGDRELVTCRAEKLPEPDVPKDYRIALDWHSKLKNRHRLNARIAREEAL